jgi:hypothetical protein
MRWLWLLLIIPAGYFFLRMWRGQTAEAALLIDSVLHNSLENLGYEPDAASLMFLSRHPFLAGRIWRMLGDGGAANMVGGPLSEESDDSCERLLRYVRNTSFRERNPCAGALMQYAVYLCDRSPNQRFGCAHPKDDLLSNDAQNI